MKDYTVTVTARGGLWRGKRTRYAVQVQAATKDAAGNLALDIAEKDLKRSREDYDSLHVTKTVLT